VGAGCRHREALLSKLRLQARRPSRGSVIAATLLRASVEHEQARRRAKRRARSSSRMRSLGSSAHAVPLGAMWLGASVARLSLVEGDEDDARVLGPLGPGIRSDPSPRRAAPPPGMEATRTRSAIARGGARFHPWWTLRWSARVAC
jgi:hypothetical protein